MPSRAGFSTIWAVLKRAHGIVFHLFDCAIREWSALKILSSLSCLDTTDSDKPYQRGLRGAL